MVRILLVNPGSSDDTLTRMARRISFLDSPAFFPPHAVAAVAAVTPREHEVVLHDENLRGPVEPLLKSSAFDVIGITLTTNQLRRSTAILEHCRSLRLPSRLVVGGIGAGAMYTRLRPLVDTMFWGEAEETWPEFLRDFEAGRPKDLYQRVAKPDMSRTPAPRWELIAADMSRYLTATVQTSRGCPFDCSFCDVIYTYGRKVRAKPVERVLEEVALLERLGAKTVMFADDNFAANRAYVKDLLRQLGPLNNSFKLPLGYLTQLDLTVADDEELLALLADANFLELQIGIESTSLEALQHFDKRQNLKLDPVNAVRKIQSYGIAVMAHMIIGADSDDQSAFERTAQFLRDANITHHQCHPLVAPPGTKMWYELKREGRLVAFTDEMHDRLDIATNIIPKRMTRIELMEGLGRYWDEVHAPAEYLERALGFLKGIKRRPRVKEAKYLSLWKNRTTMVRAILFYALKVDDSQRRAFFAVVAATQKHAPYLMAKMMFVHTSYFMDQMRGLHSSSVAREQARFERAHPEGIRVLSRGTPVAAAVRAELPAIVRQAYQAVRAKVAERHAVYDLTLEAVTDFHDRFAAVLTAFDEVAAEQLRQACDRVLSARDRVGGPAAEACDAEPLPLDAPPAGFERELRDALDRTLYVANRGWEAPTADAEAGPVRAALDETP